MILLQNPNMPVPTNAVEIDAAILDIKAHLEAGLTWLTNGYGRTYKNLDARNGTTVFYPEAYLGEQNNSHRYINLSPDNDKQGQCFFYVVRETISQFQPGMYSFLSYDTAILFSVNMELINDALLQTEIYQQILVAQVRDVLTRQLIGSSYQLTVNSVDFLFETVFSEFDLADAQQLEKAPLSHFRFNVTIQLPEACPVPSFAPIVGCKSLLLDGVNERIDTDIDAAYNLDNNNTFSMSIWLKANTISSVSANLVFAKYSNPPARGYFISLKSDKIRFSLQSNGGINGVQVETIDTISLNTWYNITATYDASTDASGCKIYLDGNLLSTIALDNTLTGSILTSEPLRIGGVVTPPRYFDGYVASARMWNTELSAADVLDEYNSGEIKNIPVQNAFNILDTDIPNSTWNGSEFTITDTSSTGVGLITVNSEESDLIEDCPSS